VKPLRDPEGAELTHLVEACPLEGKVILEIGCGDGVFMRQYSRMARFVVGIDPLSTEVQLARNKTLSGKQGKMQFLLGEGENLPFPDQMFDGVIFGSSL
jgi:ubiquinone/menaquinone biosynthesis C-methylase UbiE